MVHRCYSGFLLLSLLVVCRFELNKGSWMDYVNTNIDEQRNEFVFTIPTIWDDWYPPPLLMISTNFLTIVQFNLTLYGTDYEILGNVTKYKPFEMELPLEARIDKGDGYQQNKTVIIRSSAAVDVYALDNSANGGDVFHVLPSSKVGNWYYVAAYQSSYEPACFFSISAIYDDTIVNVTTKLGELYQITLNQYESYRFDSIGDEFQDLSGARVKSSQPVAVVSGSVSKIPVNVEFPSGLLEQLIPVSSWGTSFILAPFYSKSSFVIRVFTADNPTILYGPNGIYHIDAEEFQEVHVTGDQMVVLSTDFPVMVVQYMTSSKAEEIYHWKGAPSMMIVQPYSSYTNIATFPVLDYEDDIYYVNIIINCDGIEGLKFEYIYDFVKVDRVAILSGSDGMCLLTYEAYYGAISISHEQPDDSLKFSVTAYTVCDYNSGCSSWSSYAYPVTLFHENVTNECSKGFCNETAHCEFMNNGYYCACNQGYEGDGYSCKDINECNTQMDKCSINAECTNTEGSYSCACNLGYSGNGKTCEDIDECVAETNDCDISAECANTEGGYTCTCKTGFDGNGINCTDLNECNSGTELCANGECVNTFGSYKCSCDPGYGQSDDVTVCKDINECKLNSDSCNMNADCTNTIGSYECTCNNGYDGNGQECTDIDECSTNAEICYKNSQCTNTYGSYKCTCNSGYKQNEENCEAISITAIAVGVTAGVVVLCLIPLAIFIVKRKNKRQQANTVSMNTIQKAVHNKAVNTEDE